VADRIDVNTEKLETMVRQLRALQNKLEDVASDLQSMNMSQRNGGEYRSHASISLRNGSRISGSTTREVVRSAGRSANSLANYTGKLANSVQRVASLFEKNENQIIEVADIDVVQDDLLDGIAGATRPFHQITMPPGITNIPFDPFAPIDPFARRINDIRSQLQEWMQKAQERAERRKTYNEAIENRIKNAVDKDVAKLYKKYMDDIKYGSQNVEDGAYYQPIQNKVYINWEDDATNERGVGTTHFHEVGHMVDDYTKIFGDSSSSKDFTKALKSDFDNYVKKVMRENDCSRDEAYQHISRWLWQDPDNKNGLSDLCGGLSGKKAEGRWGHDAAYWARGKEHGIPQQINNEAFAHFFEASMSTDSTKLDYLKEVFPTAYKEFKSIVKNEL